MLLKIGLSVFDIKKPLLLMFCVRTENLTGVAAVTRGQGLANSQFRIFDFGQTLHMSVYVTPKHAVKTLKLH